MAADLTTWLDAELLLTRLRETEGQLTAEFTNEECEHGIAGYCFDCDDEANDYADAEEEEQSHQHEEENE